MHRVNPYYIHLKGLRMLDLVYPIGAKTFFGFVEDYHYSKVRPRLTKLCVGGTVGGELVCGMSLGCGVRPFHTINKLFPGLTTKDYYEIGKMCALPGHDKNLMSYFISRVIKYIKKNLTDIKVLFTWADGIMGKPGYVYQAANFYYGGFIWTDVYLHEGEKIHPRMVCSKTGHRPSPSEMETNNWIHIKGKQFRYAYFFDNTLLNKSTVNWTRQNMPKEAALEWKQKVRGQWEECEKPFYDRNKLNYYLSRDFRQQSLGV